LLTETSQDARVVKLECFLKSVSSVSPSFRCFSLSAHCCAPTPFLKAGDLLTFFVRRRFTQLQTFSVTQKSQRRPGACSQCASRVYKIPRVFPMHVRKLNRSNRPKFPRWPLPPLQGLPAQRAFGSSSSRPRKITRIASRPMYSLKRSTPLAKHLHASICSTYGPSISPYWRTSAGQK